MKKLFCLLFSLVIIFSLVACGNSKEQGNQTDTTTQQTSSSPVKNEPSEKGETNSTPNGKIDVDLSVLSSTMVYSEVYNMMTNPNDYIGKTVKMSGNFSVFEDVNTGKRYFSVLIADATACCSQGIEFVLGSDKKYPEDYPQIEDEITVIGKFQTYEEDGNKYCTLVDAVIQ